MINDFISIKAYNKLGFDDNSPPHGSSDLEIDQQAYIDRFCEVMEPPDSHAHHNDTSDEFERQIGEIEEIEHKIDLENL